MNKIFRSLVVLICVIMPFLSHAVQPDIDYSETSVLKFFFEKNRYELLKDVNEARRYEVYPVNGIHHFQGSVLKTDELVFQPGSKLVLDSLDGNFLAIVAKKIKFKSPVTQVSIERAANITLPKRSKSRRGGNGKSPKGHHDNRHGLPGGHGGNGQNGKKGLTKQLPHIYVMSNAIEIEGAPLDTPMELDFRFQGINGGEGGNGGDGGNGGNGYAGNGGDSNAVKCKRQPGDGGTGGNGGVGGAPGQGGKAGNGASITFVGTQATLDKFSYAKFLIEPGNPGKGGVRGNQGSAGKGGRAGHRRGWCTSKRKEGRGGSVPRNPHPVNGASGAKGKRGTVTMIKVKSVDELFSLSN